MDLQEDAELDSSEQLLMSAVRQRICPICLILQDKTRDLLCKLQFEAVHEQRVNAAVLSAGGYCHYHFWYLERLASPVTNARLLENLLEKIGKECLEDDSGEAAASLRAPSCPVCCSCNGWEEELMISFAEQLRQADFCTAYESSSGLCLPHLSAVLKRVSKRKERAFLVKSSRCQFDSLLQELRLLIEKAHNKDRSRGGESDASYRAIVKVVGGKNYRAG
jgi:Family of unknown function (DUF6062)